MRERQAIDLFMHRRDDGRMAVPETRHGCAATGVEILLAAGIDQENAAAGNGRRRCRVQVTMKDVRHRPVLRRAIILIVMSRSRVARAAAEASSHRIARLSPAERIAIAEKLREDGIASYMTAHGVDRALAVKRIKATHRLGRRASASAAVDER
jgi:hypothetical protein